MRPREAPGPAGKPCTVALLCLAAAAAEKREEAEVVKKGGGGPGARAGQGVGGPWAWQRLCHLQAATRALGAEIRLLHTRVSIQRRAVHGAKRKEFKCKTSLGKAAPGLPWWTGAGAGPRQGPCGGRGQGCPIPTWRGWDRTVAGLARLVWAASSSFCARWLRGHQGERAPAS